GFYVYLIFTIALLLLDNREPASTFAWLFVFLVFPVGGLVIYFMIGRNWRRQSRKRKTNEQLLETRLEKILSSLIKKQSETIKFIEGFWSSSYKKKLLRLLSCNSDSVLTTKNTLRIFQKGEDKFNALLDDLKKAEKFIHMEYFIWRSDKLTREIHKILLAKSRAGVEVRVLYDGLGSIFLKGRDIRLLRRAGVKIYPYYDYLTPITMHTLNYRNHRKIVVIDGGIGYTGGMNVGQEYIDGGRRFALWRDSHLRLEGQAVSILEGIFATDWYNTTKEDLLNKEYFPAEKEIPDALPIQITASGPDSQWDSIKQLYFMLISSAEEKIYIQSPYFIPDASIYTALKTAALSGVDVRLMITGVPDKKIPYWAAYTYFENLLQAGVRIYHYNKGFLHSKTMTVDSEICSIGTANMDVRSFHLNFEINTLIYDRKTAAQLENDFLQDQKDCKELTMDDYARLGRFAKFRNSTARLFAPLL
ncbi:MAG: cardiolipin synthase, partial [Candidatus Omnitrophica bacterium]|nr:cardiolipin synthase [Candidatus Omnitrophota bacterium]